MQNFQHEGLQQPEFPKEAPLRLVGEPVRRNAFEQALPHRYPVDAAPQCVPCAGLTSRYVQKIDHEYGEDVSKPGLFEEHSHRCSSWVRPECFVHQLDAATLGEPATDRPNGTFAFDEQARLTSWPEHARVDADGSLDIEQSTVEAGGS